MTRAFVRAGIAPSPALALAIAAACTSMACAPTIVSSSGPSSPQPADRALRCLDVAIAPIAPTEDQSVSSLRILYALHNRCAHPVTVDFAGAIVDASLDGDRRIRLLPYPASGAVLSSDIDTDEDGTEAVWYARPASNEPGEPIAAFCVNVGRLDGASAAPASCFRRAPVAGFVHVAGARTLDEALAAPPSGASALITPVSSYWLEDDDDGFIPITCHEASRGEREMNFCDAFGLWKKPLPLFGSLGLSMHRLDLRRRTFDTGAPDGVVSAGAAGAARAESLDVDMGAFAIGPLYLGGEVQFGGGSIPTTQLPSAPDLTISGGNVYFAGGAIAGLESPRLGPFDASLEMFAGGVAQVVSYEQQGSQCEDGTCQATVSSWYLEPRARVTAWLTPHFSVGAWAGAGLLDAGDGSMGLTFGTHMRSFDGTL